MEDIMKKYLTTIFLIISISVAQDNTEEKKEKLNFIFEPDSLSLNIGEEASVLIRLVDSNGDQVNSVFMIRGQRKALDAKPRRSDSTGVAKVNIKAFDAGELNLSAMAFGKSGRTVGRMKVNVPLPPLEKITFVNPIKKVFAGTSVNYSVQVYDKAKIIRDNTKVVLTSKNKKVAEFDNFGNLNIKKSGKTTITARIDDLEESLVVSAKKNPARKIKFDISENQIRTGDVIKLNAEVLDGGNKVIDNIPLTFSYSGKAIHQTDNFINNQSTESIGRPASGLITQNGKFVADTPGIYTLTAQSSGFSASKKVKVVPRNVGKRLEVVGHGTISNHNTSDLWVWPGIGKHIGKDFAVTGTHSADGEAYFWDISDPANMVIIDTIKVDARTVNDVKISEDGRVGVISREGASNRKNGLVILDVSDPFNVLIITEYNDNLTGGVHNVFIYEDHIYALSAGTRYDIINISDPANPFRVGSYELDTPGHSIHDVWVENGIAYSSNWSDGVHVVDVGGIKQDERSREKSQFNPFLAAAGQGSPGNPVKLGNKTDPNGHNHAAFPFQSESTNKFFIITGDEWARSVPGSEERIYQGGFHFIDFTDIKNPVESAIYQVPEVGSHNHWVEGDTLFAGYYYGGIRILDISGELMGDLYAQGREIAFFKGVDPDGSTANQTNVWGVIPYKGLIYFADLNNGLWAVRLVENEPLGTN
jgi:hypothetical protein